ncbi:MAG: FecR domain-containing protein [Myxococcota bacterium]
MTRHDLQLWAYASKELELGEHRYVEAHLEDCPDCVEQLAAVQVAKEALELARQARPQVAWARTDERIGAMVEKRLQRQARGPLSRRLLWGGAGLALAAAAALFVLWPREQPLPVPAEAQPVPISSWARVDRADGLLRVGGDQIPVVDGTELHGGDVVRTVATGRAFVHLPDRSHLRIGPGSQVALTRSEADDVALTLERGRLAVRASHAERKGFVVHSSGVSVHVVGTLFGVENSADVVEVSVSEGRVRVDLPNGEQAFVDAGQRLRFDTRALKSRKLKLTASVERELSEVAAVDDATTAAENRAIVAAVGGAPSAPPMVVAQGTPRSLPRLSPAEAKSRIVTPPAPLVTDELVPLPKVEAAPAPVEEKRVEQPKTEVVIEAPADVWPTLGGGEVVRGVPPKREFEPPPASQPSEWAEAPKPRADEWAALPAAKAEPPPAQAPAPVPVAVKLSDDAPAPAATAKPIAKDLESIFLGRAEESLEKGTCDRFLLGLEDIALDAQRSARTEQARVLRARCFDSQMRPRQSMNEYRKYLEEYPQGRFVTEARQALGE